MNITRYKLVLYIKKLNNYLIIIYVQQERKQKIINVVKIVKLVIKKNNTMVKK